MSRVKIEVVHHQESEPNGHTIEMQFKFSKNEVSLAFCPSAETRISVSWAAREKVVMNQQWNMDLTSHAPRSPPRLGQEDADQRPRAKKVRKLDKPPGLPDKWREDGSEKGQLSKGNGQVRQLVDEKAQLRQFGEEKANAEKENLEKREESEGESEDRSPSLDRRFIELSRRVRLRDQLR